MKKKIILSLFIISLFILSSCKVPLHYRILFGIKNSKPKTEQQLLNFIKKNNYSVENHYGLATEPFSYKAQLAGTPTWFLYNKNGFRVLPKDSLVATCSGRIAYFLENFVKDSLFVVDYSSNLKKDSLYTSGLLKLNGTTSVKMDEQLSDYTLIIYWSTFMGSYSKQMLLLEQNFDKAKCTGLKFRTYKINMDVRDYMIQEGANINVNFEFN